MFSSKSFMVSGLTFKSLIHFKLLFVSGVTEGPSVIFLTCEYLIFSAAFSEDYLFPKADSWLPRQTLVDHICFG